MASSRRPSDVVGPHDMSSVSFTGSVDIMSPRRTLNFDRVDANSTYSALSSCVKLLREAGSRQSDFVSRSELDMMIYEFGRRKVDVSNIRGFPYGADDLDEVVLLLARLQNRLAVRGMRYTSCSLREIMENTLLDRTHKTHRYDIGEWVEVLGPSMKYRLERIENVIRTNEEEGDGDQFIYETSVDHKLREYQIRWPREALQRVFGMSPWVWRQWAGIKLEKKLKFQEGDPDDFELLDIRAYAVELWELWLADKRNTSFNKLYERVGISGQNELLDHILSPFNLMHEIVTNVNDRWSLEDAGLSMFTYMSLLGTRFVDAFIVFLLQCSMPIVLFFFYTSDERDDDDIAVGTRAMLFAVMVYYMFKLNRDIWTNFNHVAGVSENTCSRIRSLRRITWENGNDTFLQSLGFTFDMLMNSGYVCLLYMFNIWILFNVGDPFEVLGSVIFFEFLFDLDEEIARSTWWDRDQRLLKAGIVSSILQNTIHRSLLVSVDVYLSRMNATLSTSERNFVRQHLKASGLTSDIAFLQGTDEDESQLLTIEERVDRLRTIESKASLADNFRERTKVQGLMSVYRNYQDGSVFERHEDKRAWSQWEILLFSFPTPTMVPPDYIPGKKLVIPDEIADLTAIKDEAILAPGKTPRERFFHHIMDVLTCRYTYRNFRTGADKDMRSFKFTRTLNAVAVWICYFLQLIFPFISLAAMGLVFSEWYCTLRLGGCTFAPSPLTGIIDDL